jgi:hypothetical protein
MPGLWKQQTYKFSTAYTHIYIHTHVHTSLYIFIRCATVTMLVLHMRQGSAHDIAQREPLCLPLHFTCLCSNHMHQIGLTPWIALSLEHVDVVSDSIYPFARLLIILFCAHVQTCSATSSRHFCFAASCKCFWGSHCVPLRLLHASQVKEFQAHVHRGGCRKASSINREASIVRHDGEPVHK